MAFNVDDMLANINGAGGLTKASKFLVRITPPPRIQGDRVFEFLCEGATLPGFSLQSEDVRMAGYGNVQKRPYAPIFQDVPLSFFCDSDGKVLRFFHRWQQSIFNWNEGTPPTGETASQLSRNDVGYPKEYFGTVEIIHYDDTGSPSGRSSSQSQENGIIKYTLNQAYPISVGDVQMNWGMDDTLVRVPVTIAFTYWNAQTLDQGTINSRSRARSQALTYAQTRVGEDIYGIRELLNATSPIFIQRNVNIFSSLLSFL